MIRHVNNVFIIYILCFNMCDEIKMQCLVYSTGKGIPKDIQRSMSYSWELVG